MSLDDPVTLDEAVTFQAMQRASRELFGRDWTELMLACQLGKMSVEDLATALRAIRAHMSVSSEDEPVH